MLAQNPIEYSRIARFAPALKGSHGPKTPRPELSHGFGHVNWRIASDGCLLLLPRRELKCCAQTTVPTTFRLNIQGKHFEVTESIRTYVEKKISHALEPFKQTVKQADVRLSVRGGDTGRGERQQKVEVTVRCAGLGVVRAEVVHADMYASTDLVVDKLHRSMRKLKEKAVAQGRWPGRGAKHTAPVADLVADTVDFLSVDEYEGMSDEERDAATAALGALPASIQKTKVFYLDEMSAADAIDRLQLVDHDFFIYLDKDSGHVQVVYKRKGGDDSGHGLIIPIPDEVDVPGAGPAVV